MIVVGLETKLASFGTWLGELTHIAWFQGLGESVSIVTGVMFVACVLLFRRGIVGEIARLLERREDARGREFGRLVQRG